MKRNLIVILLLLVAFAVKAGNITEEYAASIASKLLGKGIASTISSASKTQSSNKKNNHEQPAYYIFKGENGQGFVIISASDATMPILGFSQDGRVDKIPENMQHWLEGMQAQINEIRSQGFEPTEEIKRQWEQASIGNAKVELTTAPWGQNNPFNGESPVIKGKRAVTGCVATAYAILMKYYGSPSYGIGVTESYNTKTMGVYVPSRDLDHTYDWDNMQLSYNTSYTISQGKEVAKLVADIGSAIQIDYTDGDSWGNVGKPGIAVHFNYTSGNHLRMNNYTNKQWHTMLQDELNRKAPILYEGGTDGSGHAFVLDGYTDGNYYHVNWGWDGLYNGYFLIDGLTPIPNHNFSVDSWALLGFKPMGNVNEKEVIATVDGRLCPDMNTAFALADATHETVKLLKDCNSDRLYVWDTEKIAIDLNGKCLNTTGIFNHGSLVIMDTNGGGKITNSINDAVVSNYGELTIGSGEYINTATTYDGQYDYRRVIWTSEGSNTVINGGKFTNVAGSQCLCFNGAVVIKNGEFVQQGNGYVLGNYNTSGDVIINGGTFINTATSYNGSNDYRRAIWTSQGSNTIINGGTFTNVAGMQCLCFNGAATIENGEFVHQGNSSVLANANTSGNVIINGGTFANTATTYSGQTDYRHILWTYEGCNTVINGGNFKCPYSPWNLVSYGSMTINNADIDTPNGTDCYVGGDCTVKYARMSGKYNISGSGRTIVYEGLYSKQVPTSLLASESNCVANSDISTKDKYPYVVTNSSTGIMDAEMDNMINLEYYNVAGKRVRDPKRGSVVIIRDTKGRNVKKILK